MAQDTGGHEAAAPIFKRSRATYTQLIDPFHTVSSLYEMVNVPTGVWIDEEGMIVRPGEVAYVKKMKLGPVAVDGDAYVAALKDWVENGPKSKYVLEKELTLDRLENKHEANRFSHEADAWFKLAAYFKINGMDEKAETYFDKAQSLNEASWNYHRQDWSFLPNMGETMKRFNAKVKETTESGSVYYAPNDLSNPNAESNANAAKPKDD